MTAILTGSADAAPNAKQVVAASTSAPKNRFMGIPPFVARRCMRGRRIMPARCRSVKSLSRELSRERLTCSALLATAWLGARPPVGADVRGVREGVARELHAVHEPHVGGVAHLVDELLQHVEARRTSRVLRMQDQHGQPAD